MSNYNKILLNVIFFSLFLFIGCRHQLEQEKQEKELSLEDKITLAVESRKIPTPDEQKVSFTAPHWIEGRGPHSTEIFSHLENYLPTALIEKGSTEIKSFQRISVVRWDRRFLPVPSLKKKRPLIRSVTKNKSAG